MHVTDFSNMFIRWLPPVCPGDWCPLNGSPHKHSWHIDWNGPSSGIPTNPKNWDPVSPICSWEVIVSPIKYNGETLLCDWKTRDHWDLSHLPLVAKSDQKGPYLRLLPKSASHIKLYMFLLKEFIYSNSLLRFLHLCNFCHVFVNFLFFCSLVRNPDGTKFQDCMPVWHEIAQSPRTFTFWG